MKRHAASVFFGSLLATGCATGPVHERRSFGGENPRSAVHVGGLPADIRSAVYGAATCRPVLLKALVGSLGFVPMAIASSGRGGATTARDRRYRRHHFIHRDLAGAAGAIRVV